MSPDWEVFKEPRAFIRCLELIFGVVAFSTLANWNTEFSFNINCKNETEGSHGSYIIKVQVDYPYNLAGLQPKDLSQLKPCGVHFENGTAQYSKISFMESFDYSSDGQFFVFVGVISFLYAGLRFVVDH